MGYYSEIRAIIIHIESHLFDGVLDMRQLEREIGFSAPHIRELFVKRTGTPLVKYFKQRKVYSSAFDLLHTDMRVLDIAMKYGFESHETYLRCFSRIVGMTPAEFRRKRLRVMREELIPGVYGLALDGERKENDMNEKTISEGSTILYGVPKVEYGENCTPFPLCLKSCATYLGEDIDYRFVMAATGAAFRLVWNRTCWDLGAVDIFHTLDSTNEIYGLGAKALGREFDILVRTPETTKDEFKAFIKKHIDEGYPCMGLGIIGPPEAGIIAGYRDDGDTLLGWSFFQNMDGFKERVKYDDCGYYICDEWWENEDTQAVMCLGKTITEKKSLSDIVATGITILTGREDGNYAKGINAYDAWKSAALNGDGFDPDGNLAALYDRIACFDDAVCCLLDGRGCAAGFFWELSKQGGENAELLINIAKGFNETFNTVNEIAKLLGSWDRSEPVVRKITDVKLRESMAVLIDKAKESDTAALSLLKELVEKL